MHQSYQLYSDRNGIMVSASSRGRAGPLSGGDQVLVAADRVLVRRWGLGILEALLVVDLPQPLDLFPQCLLMSCKAQSTQSQSGCCKLPVGIQFSQSDSRRHEE